MLSKIYNMIMEYKSETGAYPLYLFLSQDIINAILPELTFDGEYIKFPDNIDILLDGGKLFGVEIVALKNRRDFIWVG